MKKILLGLALAVFLFAVAGLAGGAGVASAHEGQGVPGFREAWVLPDDFDPTECIGEDGKLIPEPDCVRLTWPADSEHPIYHFNPGLEGTWPHVHATDNGPRYGFMGVPNANGQAPAHFGHQNNPNCGNMHDIGGPPNPSGNPSGRHPLPDPEE